MVSVVREKLGATLTRSLANSTLDIDAAKELWRMCTVVGVEAGTTLFGERLCGEFTEAARDLIKTVQATQAFRTVVSTDVSFNNVGEEQPYVAVITDILGLAMEWFDGVMAEALPDGTSLPNRFRTAIVVQLHRFVDFLPMCHVSQLSVESC